MEHFTFFESYYRSGSKLPDAERLALYDKIMQFMFDDIETNDESIAGAVFEAVKPVLSKSKTKAKSGQLGGSVEAKRKQTASKTEAKRKQNGSKTEANDKQTVSHKERKGKERIGEDNPFGVEGAIADMNFSPIIEKAAKDWVKYKTEKRQEYKPIGLKSLLTEIQNNANRYGDAAVVDVIHKSMAAGYMGITWAWLMNARASPDPYQGIRDWLQEGNDDTEGVFDTRRSDEGVV